MCSTLHSWIVADEFPPWAEVKSMLPELRLLWHHRNNLSVDDNGTLWGKKSSLSPLLQLLVPKAGREQLFLSYHASLYGGHLGRTWTLARLSHRFYWLGMSDDVKKWLGQCVACVKRKSPPPVRQYPHRSSLGSYCHEHPGRLRPYTGGIPIHSGDRRLLQQVDGGFPYED